LRRLFVFASFLREYSLYSPDFNFRIITIFWVTADNLCASENLAGNFNSGGIYFYDIYTAQAGLCEEYMLCGPRLNAADTAGLP